MLPQLVSQFLSFPLYLHSVCHHSNLSDQQEMVDNLETPQSGNTTSSSGQNITAWKAFCCMESLFEALLRGLREDPRLCLRSGWKLCWRTQQSWPFAQEFETRISLQEKQVGKLGNRKGKEKQGKAGWEAEAVLPYLASRTHYYRKQRGQ